MHAEQDHIANVGQHARFVRPINPFKVFGALLLLTLNVQLRGQEMPKAVLVDEFPKITCEDLLARHDYFLTQLSNNPQDMGYAVIYSHGQVR